MEIDGCMKLGLHSKRIIYSLSQLKNKKMLVLTSAIRKTTANKMLGTIPSKSNKKQTMNLINIQNLYPAKCICLMIRVSLQLNSNYSALQ